MKDWTKMGAGDFYTDGTQMDLLADAIGDGYGTISLDELAAEVEAAPVVERADGALFGLALSEVPADGALFSVIAAA